MMKISVRVILLITLVILGFQYLTTTTELVKKADLAAQLRDEVSRIQKENRMAALRLGKRENADALDIEAKKLGLVASASIVYLPTPPSSLAVSKR